MDVYVSQITGTQNHDYFYTNAISVPVEITAAGVLLTFWDDNVRCSS